MYEIVPRTWTLGSDKVNKDTIILIRMDICVNDLSQKCSHLLIQ